MGQATRIVEKIMQEKNNYLEWGLNFPEHKRKWEAFNILVGENGSGKSRILQMIKKNAPKKECVVFHIDFASHVIMTDEENTADSDLIKRLVFRKDGPNEPFLNFLGCLDNQIISLFQELSNMWNDEYMKGRVEEILAEMRPAAQEVLHRELVVEENSISLRKGDRTVTIMEEWEKLSPGERNILLTICCVLFIKLQRRPGILLIDEMETHLHPDAQVNLYKFLKQNLEQSENDCCTCIASHSIFLLPLFEIHEVVYLHNGSIVKINGGLYQQVYDNLTGDGNKKEESLTDFLYSISAWQYADFLAQCFLKPTTVDEVKKDDEQALQFIEILKKRGGSGKKIEVLDFGAGTARIGRCMELKINDDEEVKKLSLKLRYHIYDKFKITDEFTPNTTWHGGAYRSEEELKSCNIKFDIILLYNVLHEIGVDEWVSELCFMLDLLNENGILLFGEREVLSIGEDPYGKSGYLVLGEEELSKLFPASAISKVDLPEKTKPVTLCFAVNKPLTKAEYPCEENVKEALQVLKNNTKDKIKNRRTNGLGERGKSRKYAFYCQQYVNAEEAIELLEETMTQTPESQNQDKEIEKPSDIWNRNTTMDDILAANLSHTDRIRIITEMSKMKTPEGARCRKYLEEHS